MKDTALYRFPLYLYHQSVGRFLNKGDEEQESLDEEDGFEETNTAAEAVDAGADDFELLDKEKSSAQNGNGKAVKRNKKGKGGR